MVMFASFVLSVPTPIAVTRLTNIVAFRSQEDPDYLPVSSFVFTARFCGALPDSILDLFQVSRNLDRLDHSLADWSLVVRKLLGGGLLSVACLKSMPRLTRVVRR